MGLRLLFWLDLFHFVAAGNLKERPTAGTAPV
jgi:hypothetical protein